MLNICKAVSNHKLSIPLEIEKKGKGNEEQMVKGNEEQKEKGNEEQK